MQQVEKFIKDQLSVWPEVSARFRGLKSASTRRLEVGGLEVVLQHNPARLASAVAGTDADVLKMIQKLIKQRMESAEQYTAAGRQELADNELAEAAAMEKYLPKQLSVEEVKAKVAEIITQVGATSIKDMGKVMGAANKALAGQSDGRTISTVVKELLS